MRRQDCENRDTRELEGVLARADWGTLGLVSAQGTPVLVPLNFVFHEGRIIFHGAKAGEKFGLIQESPQASFLVVEAYAQVPSYAFDPVNACPATQYFKSVLVKGRVEEVTGKFKLGQKLSSDARAKVEAVLEARGCPMDPETIALMRTHGGGTVR